eukprot:809444-Pelagomonas_calceolata.AAC.5
MLGKHFTLSAAILMPGHLQVFLDVDATLIEMNPFTFDLTGEPFPLDIRLVSCTGQLHSGKAPLQAHSLTSLTIS